MTEITARLATTLADRYTIEHELGQGRMATVYLSHDLQHADSGEADMLLYR